jgi:hypothetical protein
MILCCRSSLYFLPLFMGLTYHFFKPILSPHPPRSPSIRAVKTPFATVQGRRPTPCDLLHRLWQRRRQGPHQACGPCRHEGRRPSYSQLLCSRGMVVSILPGHQGLRRSPASQPSSSLSRRRSPSPLPRPSLRTLWCHQKGFGPQRGPTGMRQDVGCVVCKIDGSYPQRR